MKPLIPAVALAALLAPLAPAYALSVTIEKGSYQAGRGGEFVAITNPSYVANYAAAATQTIGNAVGFSTFCLERDESIAFGATYQGNLGLVAQRGGVNTDSGDPISKGTAYLYAQFAAGTLAGYDYADSGVGRKTTAKQLQDAIWGLEQEQALDMTNPFVILASGIANYLSDSDGSEGVKVISLYTENRGYRQDILVVPGVTVPDGGTMLMMLGGGVLGVAALRRRQVA